MSFAALIKFPKNTTLRFTIFYIFLFTSSVLIIFSFIAISINRYLQNDDHKRINIETMGITESLSESNPDQWPAILKSNYVRLGDNKIIYALFDKNRKFINGNIKTPPPYPSGNKSWRELSLPIDGSIRQQFSTILVKQTKLPGGFELFVGKSFQERKIILKTIMAQFIGGLMFTIVLAVVGSAIMTGSIVRRLETINEASHEFMAGNFSARIPVDETGDEYDQLSMNLNLMLDQIESLMGEVRWMSENIAHELRTPLMHLRTRLESMLETTSPNPSQRELIHKTIADSNNLLDIFAALLRISQINSGIGKTHMTEIDLANVLRDAFDLYEPLAMNKGQVIKLTKISAAITKADRHLLFQAFSNIIDNAVKYTPEGGTIYLGLTTGQGTATVTITDTGLGISHKDKGQVFKRFYRQQKNHSTAGYGLGLTLVEAIANLHHASIKLEDNNPGLIFSMEFHLSPNNSNISIM